MGESIFQKLWDFIGQLCKDDGEMDSEFEEVMKMFYFI